jgi:hypothetical protein
LHPARFLRRAAKKSEAVTWRVPDLARRYFIAPHSLKPEDERLMRELSALVPVIPVLAKVCTALGRWSASPRMLRLACMQISRAGPLSLGPALHAAGMQPTGWRCWLHLLTPEQQQ